MEHLLPTLTLGQLKQANKNQSLYLTKLGIQLSNSTRLDLTANTFGYENYNIAKASLDGQETPSGQPEPFLPPEDIESGWREDFLLSTEIRDASASIVTTHLTDVSIDPVEKAVIYTMMDQAIAGAYLRFEKHAMLYHVAEVLSTLRLPDSLIQLRDKITYILQSKSNRLPINSFGNIIKAANIYKEGKKKALPSKSSYRVHHVMFKGESLLNLYPKNRNVHHIKDYSTAFFSSTRHGKTYRMMQWAEEMIDKKTPFLYLVAIYHQDVLMNPQYKRVTSLEKSIERFEVGSSALYAIGASQSYHDVIDTVKLAVANQYHIFIDENPAMWRTLEYLLNVNYHSFTVAMQSPCQIDWYIDGDINGAPGRNPNATNYHTRDNVAPYAFDRVMLGNVNDNRMIGCLKKLGEWDDQSVSIIENNLHRLGAGEFIQVINS